MLEADLDGSGIFRTHGVFKPLRNNGGRDDKMEIVGRNDRYFILGVGSRKVRKSLNFLQALQVLPAYPYDKSSFMNLKTL